MASHLKANAIRSLFSSAALNDIRNATTPPPNAVDEIGRSAQRFELVVRVNQHGVTKTSGVRGQDIYAVTAPIVIHAAMLLMNPDYRRSGALALAAAVDPRTLLDALNGPALEVFGDA
jgi:hypothetical protein